MSNDFYSPSGIPVNGQDGDADVVRAEFASIEAAFNKMPDLGAGAGYLWRNNSGGTAGEAVAVGTAVDIGAMTAAATGKSTPVDGDSIPLSDSAASNAFKKLTWANLKATLASTFAALAGSVSQAFSASQIDLGHASDTTITRSSAGVIAVEGSNVLMASNIGATVQGYDADTAKTDVAQAFTASQRGTQTTDNDLSFDLNGTNNFKSTPTGGATLTFTNIASATGQSGNILLVNGSDYAIAAAATTKVSSSALAAISTTGTYLLGYYCDGTNVYVTNSQALA